MSIRSTTTLVVLAGALGFALPAWAAHGELDCHLAYTLNGWSLVYKHATGSGTVSCNNGTTLPVDVTAKAIGVTAGKWHIDKGKGRFTDVHDISDVLGDYAQASAEAGLYKTGEAQVLTKGKVSLALAGSGEGVDLGVDVGAVHLTKANAH